MTVGTAPEVRVKKTSSGNKIGSDIKDASLAKIGRSSRTIRRREMGEPPVAEICKETATLGRSTTHRTPGAGSSTPPAISSWAGACCPRARAVSPAS